MALLRPGIGKEQMNRGERAVGRMSRTLASPSAPMRLSRPPTPGPCTSTAMKSASGLAVAIAAVVSPIPDPISRTKGATRPKSAPGSIN